MLVEILLVWTVAVPVTVLLLASAGAWLRERRLEAITPHWLPTRARATSGHVIQMPRRPST